ncbi:MAG: hypothetical protein ACXU8O_08960, partial [Asticcacaulis sp.]
MADGNIFVLRLTPGGFAAISQRRAMPSYLSRKTSDPAVQASFEVMANRCGTTVADNARIVSLRRIVPFDFYALSGIEYAGLGIGRGVMLGSDMPEEFLVRYLEEGFFASDPM